MATTSNNMPYKKIVTQAVKKLMAAAGYTAIGYEIGGKFAGHGIVKYEEKPVIIHDQSDKLATKDIFIYSAVATMVLIFAMIVNFLLKKLQNRTRVNHNNQSQETEQLEMNDIIV